MSTTFLTRITYKEKLALLLWYVDVYLPAVAGDNYGCHRRQYKMAIERIEIRGKQRVLVESMIEAYGWLLLDNCYSKWKAYFEAYSANSKFKIPIMTRMIRKLTHFMPQNTVQ